MKILFWLLVIPFLFFGFLFIVLMLMIIISLLPFKRRKTFFIVRKNVNICTYEPSDKKSQKILDAEWSKEKD